MRARRVRGEAEGWAETRGAEGGHQPQLSCRQLCSASTLSPDVQGLLHPPRSALWETALWIFLAGKVSAPKRSCKAPLGRAAKPPWVAGARLPCSASDTCCQREILMVSPRFPPGLCARRAARAPAAARCGCALGGTQLRYPLRTPEAAALPTEALCRPELPGLSP